MLVKIDEIAGVADTERSVILDARSKGKKVEVEFPIEYIAMLASSLRSISARRGTPGAALTYELKGFQIADSARPDEVVLTLRCEPDGMAIPFLIPIDALSGLGKRLSETAERIHRTGRGSQRRH